MTAQRVDLVCARCYIGFTRFRRAAHRHRGDVELAFLPFQAAPDASAAGEPLFEVHKRGFGEATARHIASDTTLGAADGLELNFRRAVFTHTFDAHRLLAQTAVQGRGEPMTERLFRAYFADGLRLSGRPTLARLAAETGVVTGDTGTDELRAELARVRTLGIDADSIPVFRFRNGIVLRGEQSEETYAAALEENHNDPNGRAFR
ncbi:dithiol-disulfide isomerase [Streptomyces sp. PRh5]|uniref:DsbA family protein n=1 Tax=Streptomyces sp. PRh5 TaxID=1158056 RepID=UPI00044F9629|nr:DsbA family protein [Streptomyces sp. PRh5]EXU62668.1 dithiol-disulfide isomerase [Streptomyces sp. PRh5]